MKKNISINLFGTLYCIDEDAYALLQKYTDSMKSYFARQEGGEEIADDIEHRVAELMWQKKEEGFEAITIDMIKEIIAKIGNPAEIDGKEEEEETTSGKSFDEKYGAKTNNAHNNAEGGATGTTAENTTWEHIKDRVTHGHLYRNPRDKKLGGVCSGLAAYFNKGKDTGINDATFWRLGFLIPAVLLFFNCPWWMPDIVQFFIPIIYIVLWIVMPEAHTAEDRLRMQGKDVNPQSINEEILNDAENTKTYSQASYQERQNSNSGCLKVLFGLFIVILMFPFLIFMIVAITALIAASSIGSGLIGDILVSTPAESIPVLLASSKLMVLMTTVCAIVVLAIPLYFFIRWFRNSDKKLSALTIVLLSLLWIGCLGFAIFGSITTAAKIGRSTFEMHTDTFFDDDDWDIDDSQSIDDLLNMADSIKADAESRIDSIESTTQSKIDSIEATI